MGNTRKVRRCDEMDQAEYVAFELNKEMPAPYQKRLLEESHRERALRGGNQGSRKVLLIGGAGYIGVIVARYLLDCGYSVRCFDNLTYGHYFGILPFLGNESFEFTNGDLRNTEAVEQVLTDCSDVVILAGLVGDPITKKYPDLSQEVNSVAIRALVDRLSKFPLNKILFISTCSNYGLIADDEIAKETHELKPLSLYASSKVEIEEYILAKQGSVDYHATILRFATAFGYAPRMRFDLTVNEFARDLCLGKELVVYDADTWRPYCHVEDFAQIIRRVLEAPVDSVDFEIFNAGNDENNYTKRMIVDSVLKHVPSGKVVYQKEGKDRRNYRVDFSKLHSTLLFRPEYSIDRGIQEVLTVLGQGLFQDEHLAGNNSWFGNYEIALAN